jgi:uncharacterized protein YciU (UPF0263 family)
MASKYSQTVIFNFWGNSFGVCINSEFFNEIACGIAYNDDKELNILVMKKKLIKFRLKNHWKSKN